MQRGIDCGGWCPLGRLDETGRIPARYPLQELANGGFAERTRQNVRDSDGTVVFFCKELHGGTEETIRYCREQQRPHLLLDAESVSLQDAARLIAQFVREQRVRTLNAAGPRASDWPDGYDFAFRAFDVFLSRCPS